MKNLSQYLVVLALSSAAAYAQMTTGSISGSVQDPNGATVPNAKVVANNETNGLRSETVTTESGLYLFASLPAGDYSITVEKAGFKKLNRGGIGVRVAQRIGLDLKLEVGDVMRSTSTASRRPGSRRPRTARATGSWSTSTAAPSSRRSSSTTSTTASISRATSRPGSSVSNTDGLRNIPTPRPSTTP